ncbi:hypothetical protein BDP81DRAFT_413747 [Colletotrichum phormii]|uniref:Uncharacterized protein n=1 Tax=Colletotrichum phormii TaxID=359342 RepID=A0AAJ0ENT2_9PEZI|nr:uncharacterized protein BDP81DRAFT_413747 [Colletotrichum phormii]KAK1655909.1 hypothetical protein BDP81DRAFT_413747 [Colletotrichum phormii]
MLMSSLFMCSMTMSTNSWFGASQISAANRVLPRLNVLTSGHSTVRYGIISCPPFTRLAPLRTSSSAASLWSY